MNYKKAQAALEFLTTYGWAFLVILVTISALYYFGVFDFSKYLPQKCTFTSQFPCIDFTMVDTAGVDIRFMLLNDIGETISVDDIDITNDAADPLTCTLVTALPFDWDDDMEQEFEFSNCQDGAFIGGERIEAKITITYHAVNTPSTPPHTLKGKIVGIVR